MSKTIYNLIQQNPDLHSKIDHARVLYCSVIDLRNKAGPYNEYLSDDAFKLAIRQIIDIANVPCIKNADADFVKFAMSTAKFMADPMAKRGQASFELKRILGCEAQYDLPEAKRTLQKIAKDASDYEERLLAIIREEVTIDLDAAEKTLAILGQLSQSNELAKFSYRTALYCFIQQKALVAPKYAEEKISQLTEFERRDGSEVVASKVAVVQGYAEIDLEKAVAVFQSIEYFYGSVSLQMTAFFALSKGYYQNGHFSKGKEYLEKAENLLPAENNENLSLLRFNGMLEIIQVKKELSVESTRDYLSKLLELNKSEIDTMLSNVLSVTSFKNKLQKLELLSAQIK